jgi:L-rhamnose mutarotase
MTLDLKDDPKLVGEYVQWHKEVWHEVKDSLLQSGVSALEIYLLGNRLCMIMETDDSFSFERKAEMDAANIKVQEWEALMWKYQQALPGAKPGEKWMLMEKIFSL